MVDRKIINEELESLYKKYRADKPKEILEQNEKLMDIFVCNGKAYFKDSDGNKYDDAGQKIEDDKEM